MADWTHMEWYRHLQKRHGYTAKFAHLLGATRKDLVLQHDMDHDDPIGVGHVHTDPENPSKIEDQ